MSGLDKLRSFAESHEHDALLIRDGITYQDCREVVAEVAALKATNVRLQEALAADPLDQSMANEKLLEQVAEARAEVAALRERVKLLENELGVAQMRLRHFGKSTLAIDAALAAREQQA